MPFQAEHELDHWGNQRSRLWGKRSLLFFLTASTILLSQIFQSKTITLSALLLGASLITRVWWRVPGEWNTWQTKSYQEINLEFVIGVGWTAVYVGATLLTFSPNSLALSVSLGSAATALAMLVTAVFPVLGEIISRQIYGWHP